ncbi:MAG: hypothetical protein ACOYL3_04030 [Desulfuromonadaceae bacterium]
MGITKLLATVLAGAALLSGCSGEKETESSTIPAQGSSYIVVAWNDLGMHCLNPSYDTAVILPPYNTVWAQVIKRANPPQVVTSGLSVSYRILNNTTSQGKGLFHQFWTNSQQLFGSSPALDKGLNLDDRTVSNGLSGTMLAKGDHFQVSGIPVVPYDDNSTVRNPYQVAEITVKDAGGTIIAQTRATVPTSDEINCGKCHAAGGTVTQVFEDVLTRHDERHGTSLKTQKPVRCSSCHGSPVLNAPLQPGIPYLSFALHNAHQSRTAPGGSAISCYDCHPGASTQCNRSVSHTAADGNCANANCHGTMATVASSIIAGRVPWVTEPKCSTCHTGVGLADTGTTLYRNSNIGHGGIYCAGCHGSPHAMVPSKVASDNYQALQYQAKALPLGDCRNCHSSKRGGGNNFAGEHGGRSSACNVCHTGFTNAGDTTKYPHKFQW